jgi:hypothetical protein
VTTLTTTKSHASGRAPVSVTRAAKTMTAARIAIAAVVETDIEIDNPVRTTRRPTTTPTNTTA